MQLSKTVFPKVGPGNPGVSLTDCLGFYEKHFPSNKFLWQIKMKPALYIMTI